MWDFGQYNLVVKQVEGCSDILRNALGNCQAITVHSRVSERLQKHLAAAVKDLDKRALRMLALYDPYAQQLIKDGVGYDPRRDMFRKSQSAHAPQPKAIEAPKKAPTTKKVKP
jgi:hypothetical protein